jgi:hypothetical protein
MSSEPDVGTQPSAGVTRRALRARELARLRGLVRARAFWPVTAGVAAFAVAAGIFGWAAHDRPVLGLELAFSKDACCSMQVWVNRTRTSDFTVIPIQWGKTAIYSAPLHTARVTQLGMMLGDVPKSSVVVRRIWISRGSRTVDQVDVAHASAAIAYGATEHPGPGGITVTASGKTPSLYVPVSLNTHESRLRIYLASLSADPLRYVVELLLIGAILTVPFALASRRQAGLVVSIVLTVLAVRALLSLSWHLHDGVGKAVSLSSYLGVAKARELLLLDLTAVAAVAIPAGAALITRARRRNDSVEAAAIGPRPRQSLSRRTTSAVVAVPILLVALAAVPNLRAPAPTITISAIDAGRTAEYVPSWDSNNLIFWQYLINKTNLAPIKDFFWPYGFQWLFVVAAPWGIVMSYLTYVSFWAYLAIGTYLTLARFFSGAALIRRFVLVTAFWLSAELSGYVAFSTRYVAPLAVVFLFAAIDGEDGLRSWKRLLFGVALFQLTLFEVAQTVYAIVPIGFLLLVELALQVRKTRPELLRWLPRGTVTVGVPLAAAAAVLAASGALGVTTGYYGQLNALWYAWPSPIDDWIKHPVGLQAFIYWAVPVSLVLGTYGLLMRMGRLRLAYGVVVALGLLGFMVMQKQVLRPPVETQLWLPAVFGVVFWAAIETSLHSLRRWIAVSAVAGVMGALILIAGGYHAGWNALVDGPGHLLSNGGALLHQRDEFSADARAQFAPARFDKFVTYQPVVRALRRQAAVRAGGPVWILGDDSPITMMLGHSWPYYFNDLYDTSPISFQEKVIRRLERTPPVRVVWNFAPEAMLFDNVPNVVRVPLLYQWGVQHLAPERRFGQIEILRPLHPGEPVDLAWWRRRIGTTVDLGRIPEVASSGGSPCSAGSNCGTYVVVDFAKGRPHPDRVEIPVIVAGLRFAVTFETSSASHYVVPLDRVWFWAAAPAAPRFVDARQPGMTVVRRVLSNDVLY